MGGKGKKRREKNYKEAHGISKNRLPPPPVRSSLDAIPSKLRKLMSYTSGSGKLSVDSEENKRHDGSSAGGRNVGGNKPRTKAKPNSVATEPKTEDTDEPHVTTEKKKKKRKRKQVEDLRFEAELGVVGSKRKERKKKLLEERKKKHKKMKEDDGPEFPGHEEIKFGEVVEAPPKLVTVPKRFRSSVNASQERIRLKAIEAYRERKKWASRPGLHLPTLDMTSQSL